MVICAWCDKVLDDSNSELISHGICPDCKKKVELEMEEVFGKKNEISSPKETVETYNSVFGRRAK